MLRIRNELAAKRRKARHFGVQALYKWHMTGGNPGEIVSEFCDINLGKEVVVCNDTPGFIGNRIGTYWTLVGMVEAVKSGLTVEEADAVMSRPIGAPRVSISILQASSASCFFVGFLPEKVCIVEFSV